MSQPTKDPAGLITVDFDFGNQTSSTPSAATVSSTPYQGTDDIPLVMGVNSISGTVVSQPITGGTPGMIYNLRCSATFSDGDRVVGKVLTVDYDPPGYGSYTPPVTISGTSFYTV